MNNPAVNTFSRGLRPVFSNLENEMERMLWQRPFGWGNELENTGFAPACSIVEEAKQYLVQVDIPGMRKEDVNIEVENNRVTISGERKVSAKTGTRNYLSETLYGSFVRTFTLPSAIKEEKVDAHYKDGVLTIELPKLESSKAKSIKIH